jgi:hypothetical protein
VFFDLRNDSDALYAHYGIKLNFVIDVQLLEFGIDHQVAFSKDWPKVYPKTPSDEPFCVIKSV